MKMSGVGGRGPDARRKNLERSQCLPPIYLLNKKGKVTRLRQGMCCGTGLQGDAVGLKLRRGRAIMHD